MSCVHNFDEPINRVNTDSRGVLRTLYADGTGSAMILSWSRKRSVTPRD